MIKYKGQMTPNIIFSIYAVQNIWSAGLRDNLLVIHYNKIHMHQLHIRTKFRLLKCLRCGSISISGSCMHSQSFYLMTKLLA